MLTGQGGCRQGKSNGSRGAGCAQDSAPISIALLCHAMRLGHWEERCLGVQRGWYSPAWCGAGGHAVWASWVWGRGPKARAGSARHGSSSELALLCIVRPVPGCWVRDYSTWGAGTGELGLYVPGASFTVVGAQTPSQLLKSLPSPFCFWFSWVLRDGSASSWRAGSQALSPSFCLSSHPLLFPSSTLLAAASGQDQAGFRGGPVPACPGGCSVRQHELGAPGSSRGAVWWSKQEQGAVYLGLGAPINRLFALIGDRYVD